MKVLLSLVLLHFCALLTDGDALRILSMSKTKDPYARLRSQNRDPTFDYKYRLPKYIVPMSYTIDGLVIDTRTNLVQGHVMIAVSVTQPTDQLTLHANPKSISNISGWITVFTPSGVQYDVDIHSCSWNVTRETVTLKFNSTPPINSTLPISQCVIHMRYTARIGFGLYKLQSGPRYATQTEMLKTRGWMPCFDEPQLKAKFQLWVTLQGNFSYSDVVVLSNTMGRKERYNEWRFEWTPPMSTYLFTFAVGRYKSVCMDKGPAEECGTELLPGQSPKVCHWLPPNLYNPSNTTKAKELNAFGLKSYCTLQKYLNIESPVELHFLVDNFTGGGMEDWGLIDMGRHYSHEAYAHEITHYWFGDLVGPSCWPNLWLNEGFATYFGSRSALLVNRTEAQITKLAFQKVTSLMGYDDGSSPSVIDPIWANDYGAGTSKIVYDKGSLIIRMLHDVVGKECFQYALQSHIKKRAFSNATVHDLLNSFQDAAQKYKVYGWENGKIINISAFMHPYLYKSGVPKIRISKAQGKIKIYLGNPLHLSDLQMEFSITKYLPKGEKAEDWPVPLWAGSERQKAKIYWIVKNGTHIRVQGSKVKWNGKFGYYNIQAHI